jgi:septum formation protein
VIEQPGAATPHRERAPRIVLASGSPRRRELLAVIGLECLIRTPDIEENPRSGEGAAEFALRAARDKAQAVAARPGVVESELPVLGADTVVELEGALLGKPSSRADAEAMLGDLAGATHSVHTAVALAVGGRCESLVDTAVVHMLPMSEATIRWYVDTGEPMDKAGAYAIQGRGGLFVSGVEGSPHTVVGLPIHRLAELFEACGLGLEGLLSSRRV